MWRRRRESAQPTDTADLETRWIRLLKRRRELLTAMRDDLGLEIGSEDAQA